MMIEIYRGDLSGIPKNMIKTAIFFLIGLAFLAIIPAQSALAAENPRAAVDALNVGIRQSDEPNALLNAIRRVFDLERVAVSSVGILRWRQWDKAQRETYRSVFTQYMISLYLDRFRGYQGGGLKIYKVEQQKKRARVRAKIEPKVDELTLNRSDPIKIDFLVYAREKNGRDDWLITDVYFKGTISEVAGFRAQFSPVIKKEGWEGLIREMKAKKKTLDAAAKN